MSGMIAWSLQRLAAELEDPGFASAAIIEAIAETTIIDLARMILAGGKDDLTSGRLSQAELATIEDFVQDRKIAAVRASDIAAHLEISPSHLRRLFKATTGRSLQLYIEDIKKAHAIDLLANTSMPLKTIAYELGFEQVNSFCAAFKRLTSHTPGDFRRRRSH